MPTQDESKIIATEVARSPLPESFFARMQRDLAPVDGYVRAEYRVHPLLLAAVALGFSYVFIHLLRRR